MYSSADFKRKLISNVGENPEVYGKWKGPEERRTSGKSFPFGDPVFSHKMEITSGEICFSHCFLNKLNVSFCTFWLWQSPTYSSSFWLTKTRAIQLLQNCVTFDNSWLHLLIDFNIITFLFFCQVFFNVMNIFSSLAVSWSLLRMDMFYLSS